MKVPLVDLKAQYADIQPEIDLVIQRVLSHTNFILGDEVICFEDNFARFIGSKGAVGVASGTTAIHLALLACGVGPGDEVITAAHTFISTAEAILHSGAHPVFVDIDPKTYLIKPDKIELSITSRTRVILPVHLYGQPAEMTQILDIAKRNHLWVIEDAAQAHNAHYRDQKCGTLGDLACFSFYPGKNLGAYGDAGAVTGNNEELLNKVRKLRDHGRISKYEHDEIGYGERMDALQAAILNTKLFHLDEWTTLRRQHAADFNRLLSETQLIIPYESPNGRHVYHLYVVRTKQRDQLLDYLKSRGIGAGIHYPIPLHRQPAFLKLNYGSIQLPITEQIANEVLSLPLYPELKDEQIHYVASTIQEFFAENTEVKSL